MHAGKDRIIGGVVAGLVMAAVLACGAGCDPAEPTTPTPPPAAPTPPPPAPQTPPKAILTGAVVLPG